MALSVVESASLPQINVPTVRHLPNGLTIIAEQVPVEAVNLSVWLNVGSAVESEPFNGMAHFLEHMMFKGTKRLKNGEFEQLVEQRGAITNAATSQEYTHYYITAAPRDFADLAPLQLDIVFNPAIPDEAFERERPIILEEIRRSNDSPSRRAFLRSMQVAFNQLPYRRPVLGTTDVIESLTPQQMRDFHANWYRPSAMTVVAVGNLPVDDLINIVIDGCDRADVFSARTKFLDAPYPSIQHIPEPSFQTVARHEYYDASLSQARLMMMWRVPGMEQLSQTYPLDVLASVLSGGRTARLIKELREEKGLISGASVSNMTYVHQGIFYISVHLPDENVAVVERIILQHLIDLQEHMVTDAELQRIKTQVANRYVFGNETPDNRAGLYGYYQTLVGHLGPAINYPNHIRKLTPHDLRAAAQTYLDTGAYRSMVIHPYDKPEETLNTSHQ
ncbi:MAG: pitrilysin family protein [Cyanobacteria bacterium P01_F01_bin.150]